MTRFVVPWPPSILSGHAKGNNQWAKIKHTKQHREWAMLAAMAARAEAPDGDDDIAISFTFVPPDRRGDRTNFAARLKPAIDGIADAMGVNDRRFLPSYHYRAPDKANAGVIVEIVPL